MSQSRYVSTKTELSKRCGISYQRLLIYFKFADRPADHSPGKARYDVETWKRFIASKATAHNRGSKNGHFPGDNDRERSIIRKNDLTAASLELRLEKERRNLWPIQEVNRVIDTANAIVMRELRKAFEQELPPRQEGLSALEIRKMNARRLSEIGSRLPQRLKNAEEK